MRELCKTEEPEILKEKNVEWTNEYLEDLTNNTKRYRYRHPTIKGQLLKETSSKCIYCESKIGHNCAGDVEHKIPSSKDPTLHFRWENLTIACRECNRRKNDYFSEDEMFLDPYLDDVEEKLIHLGPIVTWNPGDTKAETSIKILELHNYSRSELIARKIEKIESLNSIIERMNSETNPTLRKLLEKQILQMSSKSGEFSAMVKSIIKQKKVVLSQQTV